MKVINTLFVLLVCTTLAVAALDCSVKHYTNVQSERINNLIKNANLCCNSQRPANCDCDAEMKTFIAGCENLGYAPLLFTMKRPKEYEDNPKSIPFYMEPHCFNKECVAAGQTKTFTPINSDCHFEFAKYICPTSLSGQIKDFVSSTIYQFSSVFNAA